MTCAVEDVANDLMIAMKDATDPGVTVPDISGPQFQIATDVPEVISRLTNTHLTQKTIGGLGTFDVLMDAFSVHLQAQYDAGRITGEQYAQAYTQLTTAAMQNAVQFLLAREQGYWQGIISQQQAEVAKAQVVMARVETEATKVKLQVLRYEAVTAQANYALAKMSLATQSVGFCTAEYSLDNLMPQQLVKLQNENQILENEHTLFPLKQTLMREQGESQRAQTLDTRSDAAPVNGVLGKQKELYSQQITSYRRDAENKAAKLFTDAWITMKTIDEGVLPPNGFTNTSLDQVLTAIKVNNDLDG